MAVKTIQSVENALTVIEALAAAQPIGVSALARLVELDKNAVQRVLLTLGQAGWIRQAEGGEWLITSRALQVGTHYTSGLRDAARLHIEELQRITGETVLLFARDGLQMVVLDAIDSTQALRMTVPIGTVVPLTRSAAFDAFLADSDRAQLAPSSVSPTKRAMAHVRSAGFFVLDDLYPNAMAAGAPIFDEHDIPVGSLTVVGPRVRVDANMAHHFGELTAAAAAAIGTSLSGTRIPQPSRGTGS